MYTVEYYKYRKEKPDTRGYGDWNSDIIDKTWNIKSLTIDLEDIKNIALDDVFSYSYRKKTKYLLNMYASFSRQWHRFGDAKRVKILNTNTKNADYIYSILNCDWMVNKDADINNIDVLKVLREYFAYTELYNKEPDGIKKNKLKKKVDLLKYHLDTLISLTTEKENEEEIEDVKTLKFGVYFMKDKTN